MDSIFEFIFIVVFFFGGFLLKIFKGYMEEIEREKSHKNIRKESTYRPVRNANSKRKISGENVFDAEQKPSPVFSRFDGPKFEQKTRNVISSQSSVVNQAYDNSFDDYEEKLRELNSKINTHSPKAILSGEICDECYDYHNEDNKIAKILNERAGLANAILMSEILSKPLAMRSYED